jgi:hypothetical protein
VAAARPPSPPRRAPFAVDATVACAHYGSAAVWEQLARVDIVDGDALAFHLAVRPDGWFVDVRACATCGAPFARKVLVP